VADIVPSSSEQQATWGWFAQDHGALTLPTIKAATRSHTYNWGDDPNTAQSPVNSAKIDLTNVTVAAPFTITLLALDHADSHIEPGSKMVGLWQFSAAELQFDSAALTFRYDAVLAASIGLDENELSVFRYDDGSWSPLASTIDLDNHRVSATTDHFSLFAVGDIETVSLPGDANRDGVVDDKDASILGAHWQMADGATWADGDFNADERVDDQDAAILAADWGRRIREVLPGDANDDGIVDDKDASILGSNWMTEWGATWEMGDFNKDQKVDDKDAAIFAAHWHETVENTPSVPEPLPLVLIRCLLATCVLRWVWHRRPA
jgi:hypothetical protein